MGNTVTEKILAKAAGKKNVEVGEIIEAEIDLVMGTDVMMPLSFEIMEEIGAKRVFDREKVVVVLDHFAPAPNIKSAGQARDIRENCKKFGIDHMIEVGRGGVCHTIIPDMGFAAPGEVIVGSDSHTTTYGALGAFSTGLGSTDIAVALTLGKLWFRVPPTIKVNFTGELPELIMGKDLILRLLGQIGADGARYKTLEFSGEIISRLEMDDRFTICNMGVEGGAKNAIIEPDDKTLGYLERVCKKPYDIIRSDADAAYENIIEIDCTGMEPQVACPHSPDNVSPVSEVKGIKVNQVYIGSCTNGRISDLRTAARFLKGRTVHPDVRLIVTPASQEVYLQAVREGLAEIFVEAGAAFNTPSCGACFGGHFGVIAGGEVCLSTTNRNFRGRMGSNEGMVYLASPAVAAATALSGRISDPREV
ncbi:MAG: 3-isopropylmalate dehydratase large subunit [Bacillota bacterium]|nr:3-isopropylmalate dehydratase large subunit [Bacillota bacterium]